MDNHINRMIQEKVRDATSVAAGLLEKLAVTEEWGEVLVNGCQEHGNAFTAFLLAPFVTGRNPGQALELFTQAYVLNARDEGNAREVLLDHSGWERIRATANRALGVEELLCWDETNSRQLSTIDTCSSAPTTGATCSTETCSTQSAKSAGTSGTHLEEAHGSDGCVPPPAIQDRCSATCLPPGITNYIPKGGTPYELSTKTSRPENDHHATRGDRINPTAPRRCQVRRACRRLPLTRRRRFPRVSAPAWSVTT